jgi:O-antigen/teichoic acid export membrane protein
MSSVNRPDPTKTKATFGQVIARNTLLNLAGRIITLVVALAAVPLLVKAFGADRYGLLALFWVIVGYLGLLDMGIGRTTTKFVAERLASNRTDEIPVLVWTSWWMLAALGSIAGLVLVALVPVLVGHVLQIPAYLNREASTSIYWLALMLPFAITIPGMQGFLEAQQRFDIINAIQVPANITGYVILVAVSFYTKDLSIVIIASLIAKIVVWGVYFWSCLRSMPALRTHWKISGRHLGEMLRFGGWLTVSNIVGPLMVNLDRFLIGSLVSLQAVTYYTVPYSLVTQLWMIPTSLIPVLFPAFTGLAANRDPVLGQMYRQSVKSIFLAMVFVVIAIMALSGDVLTIWLGSEFSMKSSTVMAILSLGVLVNSLAHVPFSLVQASGRPDVTAKFHLLEIVPYLALVWWATSNYGILGTAVVWLLRVGVDACLLFWFANRLLPKDQQGFGFVLVLLPMIALLYSVVMVAISGIQSIAAHFVIVLVILVLALAAAWRLWLNQRERSMIADWRVLFARQRA